LNNDLVKQPNVIELTSKITTANNPNVFSA